MQRSLTWLTWLCIPALGWAQTEQTIVVDNGDLEIPIQRYAAFADDAPILLWLPSSRGTSRMQAITATTLGDIDVETWVVDLHLAYFVDEGRDSTEHFKAKDIAELIQIAGEKTSRKVYLLGTDSGALPVLKGIAQAQQNAAQANTRLNIGGAILFHPSLTYPSNIPGSNASYRPIAKNSTIPIYYFQPSISTKQWHSQEIVKVLQTGGSEVFFHPLPQVVAGFHLRPDDDLSDADIAQRETLPKLLKQAMQLLSIQATPPAPKVLNAGQTTANSNRFGLKQLKAHAAKPLKMANLKSETIDVDYTQNKLSLVSFWTSWCEPCIKELPALARLSKDYAPQGLQIITINVAEPKADIEKAIKRFDMSSYLNLLDPEGITMKDWNVYGFPSNFLINQAGLLSYGSFGAVEWDEPENRQIVESLLKGNHSEIAN
jgi:thiol-disulfide isomerase/thioredoxin